MKDVLGGIVTVPVFWYTRGAVDAFAYCVRLIGNRWNMLGLGVWMRNIFVPMFGQRDIPGVLISFFVRLFQIIVRGMVMVIWVFIVVVLFIAYLALPVLIVMELLRQFGGVFI